MKQVLEIYGKFLLDAVVVILLLILLLFQITDADGNKGVFELIGNYLQSDVQEGVKYADFDVYKTECDRAKPVISYIGTEHTDTGVHVLTEYISAVDSEGNQIPFQVVNVIGPDGTELTEYVKEDYQEVSFITPGIYTVSVSARDIWNKKTVCTIRIPVNRG